MKVQASPLISLIMAKKILIAIITLSNSALLVLMLALGSQNLSNSHNLNLGIYTTKEAYPTGFLIGTFTVLGSISGGLTTIFFHQSSKKNYS